MLLRPSRCDRFGSVARAAGLLGDIQRDAPQNLRDTARIDPTKKYQMTGTVQTPPYNSNAINQASQKASFLSLAWQHQAGIMTHGIVGSCSSCVLVPS